MRILVIINDKAGSIDSSLFEFVRLCGIEGHECVLRFVAEQSPLTGLLGDLEGFDRVVAVGGDGTASAVCYAARLTEVPVLVYPAGTGNLLASNIGMPLDPPALARIALGDTKLRFDIGELEYQTPGGDTQSAGFMLTAGAGYDAAIMQGAEPLKPALGAAAYLVAALANMSPTVAKFRLTMDDEVLETDGIAILLMNFGKIQFDLPVTPGSDPTDGRFEIAVVRSKNPVGLIPALAAAMLDRAGDHPDRSAGLETYSAERVEIELDPPLDMQSDGDVLARVSRMSARTLPRAVTLLLPPDSTYTA